MSEQLKLIADEPKQVTELELQLVLNLEKKKKQEEDRRKRNEKVKEEYLSIKRRRK